MRIELQSREENIFIPRAYLDFNQYLGISSLPRVLLCNFYEYAQLDAWEVVSVCFDCTEPAKLADVQTKQHSSFASARLRGQLVK
eukprot:5235196-Amphidinium_carterae.1